ncbi:sugar phosphate isomerase/epimerase [bacterium]|nr:sugar phosphate isomerase/epimerase [bacterium]
MKIGISRISGSPEEAHEVFAAARHYGFEGVQMKPQQYDFSGLNPEIFKKTYEDLALLARGGLIIYPGGDFETWADKLDKLIPFAVGIGAEQICMCTSVDRSDTSPARFRKIAQILTSIGQEARRQGTWISIHNHANCLFESENDLAMLFEHLESQVCGFTLDTAHAAKAGIKDIASLVHRFREHLNNVHLKDVSDNGVFCPLGYGTLELGNVLQALNTIGYSEWLIVDEESRDFSTDEAYRISMDFLKARGLVN